MDSGGIWSDPMPSYSARPLTWAARRRSSKHFWTPLLPTSSPPASNGKIKSRLDLLTPHRVREKARNLLQFAVFAGHEGMHWVNLGLPPGNNVSTGNGTGSQPPGLLHGRRRAVQLRRRSGAYAAGIGSENRLTPGPAGWRSDPAAGPRPQPGIADSNCGAGPGNDKLRYCVWRHCPYSVNCISLVG